MAQTSLPDQICQKHLIILGQIFEGFLTQRKRSRHFDPFAFPHRKWLVERRMNDCYLEGKKIINLWSS
jgi:hypothetical protein